MVFSKITNNNIAYYCISAEVAIINSGNNVPISTDSVSKLLTKSVIDLVSKDIIEDAQSMAFVLDFAGIESVQVNAIEEGLFNVCNSRKVILANVKESIIDQTKGLTFFVKKNTEYFKENDKKIYTFLPLGEIDCSKLLSFEEVFSLTITEKLKKYNSIKKMEHHSSSVYLSSYIDMKKFIILDRPFVLYCIYRIAKKIFLKWIQEENKDSSNAKDMPVLICQSLNGSYIASVLSFLLGLDLFIIDSIGPINKLYRSLGATITPGKKYIVVSDVVCLGTEVKITKNIIEYLGGIYYGNVSIVRIASIEKYNDVESVFYIDKKNKEEFKYQIITPLDE